MIKREKVTPKYKKLIDLYIDFEILSFLDLTINRKLIKNHEIHIKICKLFKSPYIGHLN